MCATDMPKTLVMITDASARSERLGLHNPAMENCTLAVAPGHLRKVQDGAGEQSFAASGIHALADVEPSRFDILIIPDGLGNPHRLDYDPTAVAVVRHFLKTGKKIVFVVDI